MSDSFSRILKASPERVAGMMDLGASPERVWHPDELAAVFRHQMAAPVSVDLASMKATSSGRLRLLADSEGLLLKSFQDLFTHPHPPLDLLEMVKEFAKTNRDQPESLLPNEIATVLYFLCISAALVRCEQRITGLPDADLLEGLEKCSRQAWIDDAARGLLIAAKARVVAKGGET